MQNREIREELHLLAQVDTKIKTLHFAITDIYAEVTSFRFVQDSGLGILLSINKSIHTKTKIRNLPVINASQQQYQQLMKCGIGLRKFS